MFHDIQWLFLSIASSQSRNGSLVSRIVVTAHIRRMWQGNVFSLFTPGGGGVYPSQVPSPFPRLWSQVLSGGTHYLVPCPFWGVPQSWSGVPQSWQGEWVPRDRGTPPSQNWCTPWPGLGYPHPPPGLVYPPLAFHNRLRCRQYNSCDFPQEDFLLVFVNRHLTVRIMAYSRCTGLGPVQVMGLAQKETMGPVPVPVSDQCEHFCTI